MYKVELTGEQIVDTIDSLNDRIETLHDLAGTESWEWKKQLLEQADELQEIIDTLSVALETQNA